MVIIEVLISVPSKPKDLAKHWDITEKFAPVSNRQLAIANDFRVIFLSGTGNIAKAQESLSDPNKDVLPKGSEETFENEFLDK